MIEEQSHAYPIRELCAALQVSRSGYYGWRAGQESARELANGVMAQEIKQLFEAKRQRYGTPQLSGVSTTCGLRTTKQLKMERPDSSTQGP